MMALSYISLKSHMSLSEDETEAKLRADVIVCGRDEAEPCGRDTATHKPERINQAGGELEISTVFETLFALSNGPPQAADRPHSARQMVKISTMNLLIIAWGALLLNIALNLSAVYMFRRRPDVCERVPIADDSHFSK
jgi:hypothetical protein